MIFTRFTFKEQWTSPPRQTVLCIHWVGAPETRHQGQLVARAMPVGAFPLQRRLLVALEGVRQVAMERQLLGEMETLDRRQASTPVLE
jgi:hypothetical protein